MTKGEDDDLPLRLYAADGRDAGEAHYAVLIQPGETIHASDGRKLRVLEVVPTRTIRTSTWGRSELSRRACSQRVAGRRHPAAALRSSVRGPPRRSVA